MNSVRIGDKCGYVCSSPCSIQSWVGPRGSDRLQPRDETDSTLVIVDPPRTPGWATHRAVACLAASLLALLTVPGMCQAAEPIEAWIYYASPPYRIGATGGEGLAAELVTSLNRLLKGKYEVRQVPLSRDQLEHALEQGRRGFVAFAPSVIFGGIKNGPYLWTAPLFADRQELVSRTSNPFEFNGPASLSKLAFYGVQGHVYPMLEEAMTKGRLHANRAGSEKLLIKALMSKRADVITIPTSIAKYFMMTDVAFGDEAYISRQSLGGFSRHLMFQTGMQRERDDFDQTVRDLGKDPDWIAVLKRYGLTPAETNATAASMAPRDSASAGELGSAGTPGHLALVNIRPLGEPLMLAMHKVLDAAFTQAGLSYSLETRLGGAQLMLEAHSR